MDFDCEENLRSLSNKFYYAVLRKAISHSIDIFRMINSQKFSLDFSQAVMCSWGFKNKEFWVVHNIELFFIQNNITKQTLANYRWKRGWNNRISIGIILIE